MRKKLIAALHKITAIHQKYIDEAAWDRCKPMIQNIKDLVNGYNEELTDTHYGAAFESNEEINKELSELIKDAGRNQSIRAEIKRILTPVLEDVTIDWPSIYEYIQYSTYHEDMRDYVKRESEFPEYDTMEMIANLKYHTQKYDAYSLKLADILGFDGVYGGSIRRSLLNTFGYSDIFIWLKRYYKPEYWGKELPKKLKLSFPTAMEILEELD